MQANGWWLNFTRPLANAPASLMLKHTVQAYPGVQMQISSHAIRCVQPAKCAYFPRTVYWDLFRRTDGGNNLMNRLTSRCARGSAGST